MCGGVPFEHISAFDTQELFPRMWGCSDLAGPFNLIIINKRKKNIIKANLAYKELKDSLKDFKYNCYEIYSPSTYLNSLDFIEFDLALIIKDTLFLIEILLQNRF
jgi:hypothetical protein